eukprot:TRINITY_DN2745_c0_g1_i1.p1 TRINITY_DN2745_c0_g1~~TRINITY_DN2745_c0_g1_i1.p1  ORF type:complete len:373 (+),score=78.30 TRINITY_DN2745_c0_g1_i1:292-1410(+)
MDTRSKRSRESDSSPSSSSSSSKKMNSSVPIPLFSCSWKSDDLLENNPPKFRHPYKKRLWKDIKKREEMPTTSVSLTKWSVMSLPTEIPDDETEVVLKDGPYQYERIEDKSEVHWWVNFADLHLFGFYASPLFAQDEIQSMEHPILGAVREALEDLTTEKNDPSAPLTRTSKGSPTPILISGVPRMINVDTSPNEEEGRPKGLYGNMFAFSELEDVLKAVTPISPPTISNIIAMEAPKGFKGKYTKLQILDVFLTSYTAFRGAVLQTQSEWVEKNEEGEVKVVIHSGAWGCGAYGGNKALMSALQILAARCAKVPQLVLHTFDPASREAFENGKNIETYLREYQKESSESVLDDVLNSLKDQKFMWGVGDGN